MNDPLELALGNVYKYGHINRSTQFIGQVGIVMFQRVV